MLKQSPSKNLRSKGFKVKHVLQICLLLAICFWLLHQVRHSYGERKAYEQSAGKLVEMQNEHESIKLGRRDLRLPVQETTSETDKQGAGGEFAVESDEKEMIKPENSKDEGRGGGDDEIDGNDQEKSEEEDSEEVEDLIDEEDREREDETEEQESQELENEVEDERLLVNQGQYGGDSNAKARKEQSKGENAAGR